MICIIIINIYVSLRTQYGHYFKRRVRFIILCIFQDLGDIHVHEQNIDNILKMCCFFLVSFIVVPHDHRRRMFNISVFFYTYTPNILNAYDRNLSSRIVLLLRPVLIKLLSLHYTLLLYVQHVLLLLLRGSWCMYKKKKNGVTIYN